MSEQSLEVSSLAKYLTPRTISIGNQKSVSDVIKERLSLLNQKRLFEYPPQQVFTGSEESLSQYIDTSEEENETHLGQKRKSTDSILNEYDPKEKYARTSLYENLSKHILEIAMLRKTLADRDSTIMLLNKDLERKNMFVTIKQKEINYLAETITTRNKTIKNLQDKNFQLKQVIQQQAGILMQKNTMDNEAVFNAEVVSNPEATQNNSNNEAEANKVKARVRTEARAEARVKAMAEAKAKAVEANAKARAETNAKIKARADAKAKARAETNAKIRADAKAKARAEEEAEIKANPEVTKKLPKNKKRPPQSRLLCLATGCNTAASFGKRFGYIEYCAKHRPQDYVSLSYPENRRSWLTRINQ